MPPAAARTILLPGGHHFGGNYERIAALILENAQAPAP
jgi:type IV secretory pathway VirJ component